MQIPKKLKIGAFTIPVKWEKELELEGSPCNGTWCSRELEIKIDPALNSQHQASTFLHEIIHAILWTTGITYILPEDTEEQFVAALSCGLYQVLKDNKLIFD